LGVFAVQEKRGGFGEYLLREEKLFYYTANLPSSSYILYPYPMENLHFQLEPQLQFGPLFGIRRVVPRVNGSGIQITTPNCSFAEQRVFASDTRGFAARPLAGFAAPSALGRALNNHNTTTHHHTPHHTAPHPPYTTVFLVSIYPHSVPWTQTPLLTPPLQCFVWGRGPPLVQCGYQTMYAQCTLQQKLQAPLVSVYLQPSIPAHSLSAISRPTGLTRTLPVADRSLPLL